MKIILASKNQGKIAEFKALLSPLHIELTSQNDLSIPDMPETAKTFVENALAKARYVSSIAKLPAIGDDSGLVVPALNGAPGIYSARFAGEEKNNTANIQKLLTLMNEIPEQKRNAFFYCSLVYVTHEDDPTPIICSGSWQGKIAQQPKGEGGFGYDPIFYLPELRMSAAELSKEVKNKISHRALAVQSLLTFFREHK